MELTAEFVKTLNAKIAGMDVNDKRMLESMEHLKEQILGIMKIFETSEQTLNRILNKIEAYDCDRKDEPIYIRCNRDIQAIVTLNEIKPIINNVEKLEDGADNLFSISSYFEPLKEYVIVKNEEALRELDSSLKDVCLAIFDHEYRSYEGFTCFLAIYLPSGYLYIVDGIKFREILPHLRLLKGDVNKIIHCQRCVERLIKDFGNIKSYQNFSAPDSEIYVDWRIRPLNEDLISIICRTIQDSVENINDGISTERHEASVINEIEAFAENYGLPPNMDILPDLLKLRQYLARTNEESINYIMSDTQLYNLIVNNPVNLEEFEHLFDRMSSVLRLHVTDFLLIFRRRSKMSLERLKLNPKIEEEYSRPISNDFMDRYRNFGGEEDGKMFHKRDIDSESSFEISDE